jgi:hypothetical protein
MSSSVASFPRQGRLFTALVALTVIVFAALVLRPAIPSASASSVIPQANVGVPEYRLAFPTQRPPGFAVDGAQAMAIAKRSPVAIAIHRREHPLQINVSVWLNSHYDVYMFFHGKPVADVEVMRDGRLGRTWTGPLIEAVYGRGDYAPLFDSPWVSVTFGLLFLLPFISLRRRPTLRQLDLVAVLSFGVSYWLFNQRHFEPAVWLAYVPLLYFLGRMLSIGFRRHRATTVLHAWVSTRWLFVGLIALVATRIMLSLHGAAPTDVGLASVVGGYRILHGLPIYYTASGHPDTYGPINYLAYVPFDLIFPWSGKWDYLAAARAASITFDLMTIGGLFLVGRQLRPGAAGKRLGLLLAYLWAACPFTLFAVMRGTNDGLVSVLLVAILLTLTRPAARGILLGLGTAAKFVPGLLLPLIAVGPRPTGRAARATTAAAVIVTGASFALFLPPGGAREVWDHTLGFQLNRHDLFSIWGLHPSLDPVKTLLGACAVILAVVAAFRPRGERSLVQISALMAAVLIAAQLPAVHWFYYYIVWFLPLVLVTVVADRGPAPAELAVSEMPLRQLTATEAPVLAGAKR